MLATLCGTFGQEGIFTIAASWLGPGRSRQRKPFRESPVSLLFLRATGGRTLLARRPSADVQKVYVPLSPFACPNRGVPDSPRLSARIVGQRFYLCLNGQPAVGCSPGRHRMPALRKRGRRGRPCSTMPRHKGAGDGALRAHGITPPFPCHPSDLTSTPSPCHVRFLSRFWAYGRYMR